MNYGKIDRQLSPRTQRFMRELVGPAREKDSDVRFWRGVSALVCVAVLCGFITLLGFVAGCTPPAGESAAQDDLVHGEYAGYPKVEEKEAPAP